MEARMAVMILVCFPDAGGAAYFHRGHLPRPAAEASPLEVFRHGLR
jgi:hypothetical protein